MEQDVTGWPLGRLVEPDFPAAYGTLGRQFEGHHFPGLVLVVHHDLLAHVSAQAGQLLEFGIL